MDPEAAYIVFDSLNCPKTIVPWECCIDESNIPVVTKSRKNFQFDSLVVINLFTLRNGDLQRLRIPNVKTHNC